MSKYTNNQIAKHIMRTILTRAGEIINYDWDEKFCADRMRDCKNIKANEWFQAVEPSKLTKDEMLELGFSRWSDESDVMLIPIWLLPFLPEEIELICIDGEKGVKKISEIDNDHRFGCLAYGVIPATDKE